ncbi:MAG: hypothetical protein Q9177_006170, partial [Variospora cf. flavescens]
KQSRRNDEIQDVKMMEKWPTICFGDANLPTLVIAAIVRRCKGDMPQLSFPTLK